MTDLTSDIREALRRDGPESASALARRLGVSTPTVTRALSKLGDAIVTIGKGRSSRCALYREVRDLGHAWPLYRIDRDGQPELLGRVEALHGRYRWRLVPEHSLPLFMRGEFEEGLYEDLPWFLQALRPQGYLGREQLKGFTSTISAPDDITLWQADDILSELEFFGLDLPGNLILGNKAQVKIELCKAASSMLSTSRQNSKSNFIAQAERTDVRTVPGSSAAGERPKFIAVIKHPNEGEEYLIVKFAPLVQGNPTAQRWADLLVCEEIALRSLAAHGVSAAQSEILDAGDWRFLQSTRFDRTPQGGRVGVFALDALDMAYVGSDQRDWLAGAEPLHAQGLIDAKDLDRIRLLHAFGRLIGNNDMHHGNLSFYAEPQRAALRLAPIYDMLPMHYRPAVSGLVRETPFDIPPPDPHHRSIWAQAAALAEEFWAIAARDPRLSEAFAAVCANNGLRVSEWKAQHGL